MSFTRTTFLRNLKIGSTIVIILIIVAYALWRSFAYARGPHITITEPLNFSSINSTTTQVIGRVERANTITLNGKPITIDEQGNFNEIIVLFPGTNILTIKAHDQFDRTVQKEIRVVR
jgi:hypothetical protein